MGGEGMRGQTRPRVTCPRCSRSIALTFNARTGEAYLRSHVSAPGQPCSMSTRPVSRATMHDKPR